MKWQNRFYFFSLFIIARGKSTCECERDGRLLLSRAVLWHENSRVNVKIGQNNIQSEGRNIQWSGNVKSWDVQCAINAHFQWKWKMTLSYLLGKRFRALVGQPWAHQPPLLHILYVLLKISGFTPPTWPLFHPYFPIQLTKGNQYQQLYEQSLHCQLAYTYHSPIKEVNVWQMRTNRELSGFLGIETIIGTQRGKNGKWQSSKESTRQDRGTDSSEGKTSTEVDRLCGGIFKL